MGEMDQKALYALKSAIELLIQQASWLTELFERLNQTGTDLGYQLQVLNERNAARDKERNTVDGEYKLKCDKCGKTEGPPFDADDACVCGGRFVDTELDVAFHTDDGSEG